MDPVAWLIVAHGGLYGALAEASIVAAIGGFLSWVWLSERRRRRRRGESRRTAMRE